MTVLEGRSPHGSGDGRRSLLKKAKFPLVYFLVLCSLQTVWFIARVGPLTMPDPDIHALATYALATGQSMNKTTQEKDRFGNLVKVQQVTGDSRYLHIDGRRGILATAAVESSRVGDFGRQGQEKGAERAASIVTIPNSKHPNRSNQYFPLLYLPQATGMRVALWIHLPAYDGWQLSRVSNFLAFALIWGFAIVLAPRGRMLLAFIGALPLTVFMASSLMIDGTVMALSALFAAMLVRCTWEGHRLSNAQLAGFAVVGMLLVCAKTVYSPILLVVLALPRCTLTKHRKAWLSAIWVMMALLIFVPWYTNYSGTLAVANIGDNLRFTATRPLRVIAVILNNAFRVFAHLPQPVMAQVIAVSLIWLAMLAFYRSSTNTRGFRSLMPEPRYTAIAVMSGFITISAMMLFLCLTWNNLYTLQGYSISGFQERYLFPLLPLMVLSFARSPQRTRSLQEA